MVLVVAQLVRLSDCGDAGSGRSQTLMQCPDLAQTSCEMELCPPDGEMKLGGQVLLHMFTEA